MNILGNKLGSIHKTGRADHRGGFISRNNDSKSIFYRFTDKLRNGWKRFLWTSFYYWLQIPLNLRYVICVRSLLTQKMNCKIFCEIPMLENFLSLRPKINSDDFTTNSQKEIPGLASGNVYFYYGTWRQKDYLQRENLSSLILKLNKLNKTKQNLCRFRLIWLSICQHPRVC